MRPMLRALFGTKLNAALTMVTLALVYLTVPPFLNWALAHATWDGLSRRACAPDGACWAFVKARFPLFIYGRYPQPERWRVDLAFVLLATTSSGALFARRRGWWVAVLLVGMPIVGGVLLVGGVFGLPAVATGDWGGLMLNVVLTFVAVVGSLPLGILLAFGRQSSLPVVRWGSIAFIELWRGSPLLAVLFMGLIMLPMFLPAGMTVDNLIRAIVVMTLFESAYMAETVRGGLQSVARGQTEAALALGMHTATAQALVVLPQAMRLAIPGIINIVVDLFKDTTLVSIVGLFELMGVINQSLKDPNWLGLAIEGYTFAMGLFFVACLVISLAGQTLERQFGSAARTPRR
ncbi:MAG: amino acid ABC transporter permease [Acetobacteraceae bacterium]|jgi:general L-amino acid transport system permease protein